MTGAEYLLRRLMDLEGAVATLIDQKAAVEAERDALKAERDIAKENAKPPEVPHDQ